MWQAVIVGLIVLAAATYAAWALLPAALRLRLARHLAATARRVGGPAWLVTVRGRDRGQRAAAPRRLQRLQRGAGGPDPAQGPRQNLNIALRGRATAVARHRFR